MIYFTYFADKDSELEPQDPEIFALGLLLTGYTALN